MAQAPQQQIQVIQPLNGSQLQQLYMPQQQMVYSGHLSGSTLQQISPAAGVSFHIQPKGSLDSKTYGAHNVQPHQRILLQPKPHYTSLQGHSTVQVFNGSNLNQMPQRQVISAQAPGSMYSQPQMLGSYALSPLPPGYSWASSSYSPQSPFIIRTPQPNIYVQQAQPQTSMHMSMPVQAPPQAVPPISFSEVCQETQTITTESLNPSATQSVISCSTIPANVSPNSVSTTLPSIVPKQPLNHQANMYSAPTTPNQANQYSQSFIPNQASPSVTYNQVNQSIVSITHPANQPVDSTTHNIVNQSVDYISHNPVTQTVESITNNPINQPMGSVSHSSVNQSMGPVIHNQSNQYLESQNQYAEAPALNQANQSVEPVVCNQNEQFLESPNCGKLKRSDESHVGQSSQQSSFVNVKNNKSILPKQTFPIPTKCGIKTEQSGEVLIPPSPLSKEYRLKVLPQETQRREDLPTQGSPTSTNGGVSTSIDEPMMTVTSSSSSDLTNSSVQAHSMKSFVETYSYTVVSPTSSGQSDMSPENDNVQKVGSDFYPIIKLKRLKPQDPLGKQDSVEKHPQKAIVKPQMLALPDSYLLQEQPESFSENLKSVSHTSPDSLPIKKRKLPAEMDNFPDSSTNYLGYISPATVQRGRGRGRGRKRGRASTSGTPKKLGRPRKTPVVPMAPVAVTTPVPPVIMKQEVVDQNTEMRRSARKKVKIEVIELVDDNNDSAKTTGNKSPNNISRTQDPSLSKSTAALYNIGGHLNKDNIATTPSNDEGWNSVGNQDVASESPSTPKIIPFELGNCNIKQDKPLKRMSVQEVCEFVCSFPGCLEYGEVFKSQEIDGQALLLLNLDHLMTGFCMKLGPAVKLICYINTQKEEDV